MNVSEHGAMGPGGPLEKVLAAAGGWTGMGRVQAERPGDHSSGWAAGWWLDPGSWHGRKQVEKLRRILEMELAEPGVGRLEEENVSECLGLA